MVAPRRMLIETDEEIVELSTAATPRRAAEAEPFIRKTIFSRFLAPAAAVTVAGLAAGVLLWPSQGTTAESATVDPDTAASALGLSRNSGRAPLVQSPSPSPSPSESAAASPSPVPSPSPSPVTSPSPSPTPTVDYTTLGAAAGTRYASSGVNVRSGAGTGFDLVTTLEAGAEVTITERVIDGWRQVVINDASGWINESYLSAEPVEVKTGFSTEQCPTASSLEPYITEQTRIALRAVCGQFPNVKSYGGYRPGDWGYHGSGQAIDVMISGEAGWELANWAQANAAELGITEIIYSQKIWTTKRAGEGWRWMSDRGSVTQNHYDHVHLSVTG